jgi:excisionase family DNA binding protein
LRKFLTIRQFAEQYQVSRSTIYRLLATGRVVSVKIGRSVRITVESAVAWERGLLPPANDNG